MILEALERQTGAYGTVNKGDTVNVSDSLAAELIANGAFKEVVTAEEVATPGDVVDRNESGNTDEPVHVDGEAREILNDEGRKLHESGELAEAEAEARVEAGQTPDLDQEPISVGDETARKKRSK